MYATMLDISKTNWGLINMEPCSLIVGALIAGALPAVEKTAGDLIQDSYNGLKSMVIEFWSKKTGSVEKASQEVDSLIQNCTDNKELYQKLFLEQFKEKVEPTQEMLDLANKIHNTVLSEGNLNINIGEARGIQIGNHNTQNNSF